MQAEIFAPIWFEHFLHHARPTKQDPVLLILDGHATHTRNLTLLEMARANNVHILVIPPHTSHRLQALDVGFMKPFSTFYSQTASTWLRNNPGKVITLQDISPIFGESYMGAATTQTAVSAFRSTGVCPFNPHIFPEETFEAAETTNRPQKSAQEENNEGRSDPITSASTNSASPNPASSTLLSVTPEDILPLLKAGACEGKKKEEDWKISNNNKISLLGGTKSFQKTEKKCKTN